MNVIIYCLHDNGTAQAGAKTEAQQHANAKPQEIAHPPLGCFRAWPASEPWSSCLTRSPGAPKLRLFPRVAGIGALELLRDTEPWSS
jgi:hypothetical protein